MTQNFGLPAPNEFDGSRATTVQGTVNVLPVSVFTVVDPDDAGGSTFSATGASVTVGNLQQAGSIGVQITGTWSGTLSFQASIDGVNYAAWTLYQGTTGATTATASGFWFGPAQGLFTFRVVATSITSGSAVVSCRVSAAPYTYTAGPITGTGDTGSSVGVGVTIINGRAHLLVYDDTVARQLDSIILVLTDISISLRALCGDSSTARGLETPLQTSERNIAWP